MRPGTEDAALEREVEREARVAQQRRTERGHEIRVGRFETPAVEPPAHAATHVAEHRETVELADVVVRYPAINRELGLGGDHDVAERKTPRPELEASGVDAETTSGLEAKAARRRSGAAIPILEKPELLQVGHNVVELDLPERVLGVGDRSRRGPLIQRRVGEARNTRERREPTLVARHGVNLVTHAKARPVGSHGEGVKAPRHELVKRHVELTVRDRDLDLYVVILDANHQVLDHDATRPEAMRRVEGHFHVAGRARQTLHDASAENGVHDREVRERERGEHEHQSNRDLLRELHPAPVNDLSRERPSARANDRVGPLAGAPPG